MKKKLTLALIASLALTTGSAFAADFDTKFDGNVSLQYRDDERTVFGTGAKYGGQGFKETITLNSKTKIADGVDFYTRMTYQNLGNGLMNSAADYAGRPDTGYNGAIDAFGFKIATGSWNWTIGSQPLTIGAQGLVYDNGFIGRHALPYAVNGAGKIGAVDTSVYYARTNYQSDFGDQDKFYGTNLSYDLNANSKVGAFYARWAPGADWGIGNQNAYGIDYSYKFNDKVSFAGEYSKTSASAANKAYIAGLSYAATNADTFGAKYYRSEVASQIVDKNFGGMGTTPNPDTKGYILSYNHTLDKASTIGLSYDCEQAILGTTDARNRTKLTYSINF